MKNFNLIFSFILFASIVSAQTVNSNFETWETDTNQISVSGPVEFQGLQAEYEIDDPEFTYPSPAGWSSVSQITGTESMTFEGTNNSDVFLVTQSSDAQDLSSSAQIETRRIDIEAEITVFNQTSTQTFTNQAPGLLVSGDFKIDFADFADEILLGGSLNSLNPFTFPNTGQPIDFAPNTLKGFYKYSGVNGTRQDSALIFSGVIKEREIIAYAIQRLPDAATFTPFEMEYNYLSCETPDTIITTIVSSNLDVTFQNGEFSINSNYTGEDGSVLIIDNLTMDTFDFDNFPPAFVDDNFTVTSSEATELDIIENDFSCGEDPLVPIILDGPAEGNASVLGNNNVSYTSDVDYTGNDSLTYYVCTNGGCDTATVFIEVSPIPLCEALDVTRTMESNTVDVFNATANDINCGAIPELVNQPQNGVASVLADGQISYSPNNDYVGTDSFDYFVCSDLNQTQCDTATVNYTVILGLNDLNSDLFSIYPNPVQNVLNIQFEGHGESQIYLYDLQGKMILLESFNKQIQLNTSSLASGLYILKLETNQGIAHQKIQISK